MGKGLSIPTTGRCIAISGGTGILVFIDLVAHLILRIIEEMGGPSLTLPEQDSAERIDLQNFTFELYTAFRSPEEAIGLELIDCLTSLCEKHSLPSLFKHIKDLESQNKNHKVDSGDITSSLKSCDNEFYLQKFDEYRDDKNMKKVWICGPPSLNESIDRNLFDYMKDPSNKLESAHVEYCMV